MTRLVPLAEIRIPPDRQRTRMDPLALNELSSSIQANGLLHPPVIALTSEGYDLIAGGRRIAAIDLILAMGESFSYEGHPVPEGMVPVTPMSDLTHLQRMELELEENIRREDLSWQDRAAATARIQELKNAIATESGKPLPPVKQIADEIGEAPDKVMTDLDLARNLDDPAIAKAATKKEALKILKRKVQTEANEKLAAAIGRDHATGRMQVHQADCLEWMASAAPEQFDVILTDPPYGMGADQFGDSGGVAAGAHGYKDDANTFISMMESLPAALWRVAKPEAHLYMFCDIGWFQFISDCLTNMGWRVHRTPIIWHKPNGLRAPWPEHGPWRRYETLVYAIKGDRKTTGLYPDLVTIPSDDNLGHAAQKPVALYADLLRRSVRPGDSVFDPFCGSGPIFPAAQSLKCYATGVEQDAASYGISLKRIAEIGG